MGYAKNNPSYRVWNPLQAKKVANVGGAKFDESMGTAWWRGGLGVEDLANMEVVIFSDAEGDALDTCTYTRGSGCNCIILGIHVVDQVIAGSNAQVIKGFKQEMGVILK